MKHNWVIGRTQCSLCFGFQTPENVDDDRCSGSARLEMQRIGSVQRAYEFAMGLDRREDGYIAKHSLVHGQYYMGRCRNAGIARWDAVKQVFVHWRAKFGSLFLEEIKCREDELHFDVFDAREPFYHPECLKPIPVSPGDKPESAVV